MGLRAHEDDGSNKGGSKWMWGCCGGCAGIGVVAVVGFAIFVYMMIRSQRVVPPETFFQPRSDALVVAQLRPEHHDLAMLLRKLADDPPEGMEMTADEKKQLEKQAGSIPSQLSSVTPLQVVILARQLETAQSPETIPAGVKWKFLGDLVGGIGEKKRFAIGGAVSLKAYGGAIGWTLSGLINTFVDEGGYTEKYEGVKMGIPPNENFYLAALNNNFMLADSRKMLTRWIDELKNNDQKKAEEDSPSPKYTGPSALKSVYAEIEPRAPLIFGAVNTGGQIGDFIAAFEEVGSKGDGESVSRALSQLVRMLKSAGISSDSVDAFGGYLTMKGPNTAAMYLFTQCSDRTATEKMAKQIGSVMEARVKGADYIRLENMTEGTMVRTVITLEKVEDIIRKLAKRDKEKTETHAK